MKKIDSFTNQYSLPKTLRFSLIPLKNGKTEENFKNALLLEKDKERAEKYIKVKGYIDRYHKSFINDVLSEVRLDKVGEYAELYFKSNKDDKETESMGKSEDSMRKTIAESFKKDKRYGPMFNQNMIENVLMSDLT